jgi:aminoglycoside phosphotransferase (APT) family kinase protein
LSLVVVDDGFDFKVVLVDERWVVRIPRRAQVVEALQRETALLKELAPALPVAVPRFELVSTEPPFVVYPLIEGRPLVEDDPEGIRAFLDALHGIQTGLLPAATWVEDYRAQCVEFEHLAFPFLSSDEQHRARTLFAEVETLVGFEPCVIHGDLGAEHLLVRDGRLVGVIDWGDARMGDPALDYSWLLNDVFPDWEVDDDLRRRAGFYHRLAPFFSVHYGVFRHDEDYTKQALARLRTRL